MDWCGCGGYYKCPTHPHKQMTSICTHPQCFEPLCDQCLIHHRDNIHPKLPYKANIEKLQYVQKQAKTKIKTYQNKLQDLNKTRSVQIKNAKVRLIESKKFLLQTIQNYFSNLEKETKLIDKDPQITQLQNDLKEASSEQLTSVYLFEKGIWDYFEPNFNKLNQVGFGSNLEKDFKSLLESGISVGKTRLVQSRFQQTPRANHNISKQGSNSRFKIFRN